MLVLRVGIAPPSPHGQHQPRAGNASLDEMIGAINRGIYMRQLLLVLDDSRNKFQFGCEWGQLIEGGRLTTVVKNPNYRGISATFWRSLAMVGNRDTVEIMGTPNLWQGRTESGHAHGTCCAGLSVRQRRGFWWRIDDAGLLYALADAINHVTAPG